MDGGAWNDPESTATTLCHFAHHRTAQVCRQPSLLLEREKSPWGNDHVNDNKSAEMSLVSIFFGWSFLHFELSSTTSLALFDSTRVTLGADIHLRNWSRSLLFIFVKASACCFSVGTHLRFLQLSRKPATSISTRFSANVVLKRWTASQRPHSWCHRPWLCRRLLAILSDVHLVEHIDPGPRPHR